MAVAEKGRGGATGIGALSVAMWHGCPARVESAVYLLSSVALCGLARDRRPMALKCNRLGYTGRVEHAG